MYNFGLMGEENGRLLSKLVGLIPSCLWKRISITLSKNLLSLTDALLPGDNDLPSLQS